MSSKEIVHKLLKLNKNAYSFYSEKIFIFSVPLFKKRKKVPQHLLTHDSKQVEVQCRFPYDEMT